MAINTHGRPLSPHLQVYRLPLTAWLSILHRGTGVVLSLGLILLTAWLFSLALGVEAFDCVSLLTTGWFGKLVLAGFSFCLFYHLANGLRHLVWDTGRGLDLKSNAKLNIAVIISSLIMTAIAWCLAYCV